MVGARSVGEEFAAEGRGVTTGARGGVDVYVAVEFYTGAGRRVRGHERRYRHARVGDVEQQAAFVADSGGATVPDGVVYGGGDVRVRHGGNQFRVGDQVCGLGVGGQFRDVHAQEAVDGRGRQWCELAAPEGDQHLVRRARIDHGGKQIQVRGMGAGGRRFDGAQQGPAAVQRVDLVVDGDSCRGDHLGDRPGAVQYVLDRGQADAEGTQPAQQQESIDRAGIEHPVAGGRAGGVEQTRIDRVMPPMPARLALARVWTMGAPFHAQDRLAGYAFTATDTSWAAGTGTPITGTAAELLMVVTGRTSPGQHVGGSID